MDKNNFVKPIPRKKADDDVLHTGRNDLIDNTSIVNRIKKFCKEILINCCYDTSNHSKRTWKKVPTKGFCFYLS